MSEHIRNLKNYQTGIDYLRKLDPEKFNICTYGYEREGCGFVGCAAGWWAYDDVFPRYTLGSTIHGYHPVYTDERGEKYSGATAIAVLLGITGDIAHELFNGLWRNIPPSLVTPDAVADAMVTYRDSGVCVTALAEC